MEINGELLEKAIIFAVEKHKGQVRKGDGRPYILHPLSVMFTLGRVKDSKNKYLLAIAAIGHDLVEDTDVTIEEIGRLFGWQVAALVDELTTDEFLKNKLGKTEYLCRKMFSMSSYALCIKLCDRLDNLSDCKSMSTEFINKYHTETETILDRISGRKLTYTHKKIIKLIQKQIKNNAKYLK